MYKSHVQCCLLLVANTRVMSLYHQSFKCSIQSNHNQGPFSGYSASVYSFQLNRRILRRLLVCLFPSLRLNPEFYFKGQTPSTRC